MIIQFVSPDRSTSLTVIEKTTIEVKIRNLGQVDDATPVDLLLGNVAKSSEEQYVICRSTIEDLVAGVKIQHGASEPGQYYVVARWKSTTDKVEQSTLSEVFKIVVD